MTRMLIALAALMAAAPAVAQTAPAGAQTMPPTASLQINLSGPRFGWTFLSAESLAAMNERGIEVGSIISQFGWQFERRFYVNGGGTAVLHEFIPMVAGLDHGMAIPTLTYMVGVRTAGGAEFGIGPNFTPGGYGLAVASGLTLRHGALNVPLNVAIVAAKSGSRISFLTGFNLRR